METRKPGNSVISQDTDTITINQEKESLKRTILEVIGAEALKQEVKDDLKESGSRFDNFLKHPATLLVIGFIFTTAGGTIISSCYQSREWTRQQHYLAQQRRLDEMNKVAKETIETTAEMLSAADDALAIFFWNSPDIKQSPDDKKRGDHWGQASLKWRNAVFTLPPELKTYFKDQHIQATLKDIDSLEVFIGNDLKNLLTDYDENKKKALSNKNNQNDAASCRDKINQAREKLGNLTSIMTKEIHEESERQGSQEY
jgi:hypothetical protein